MARQRTTADAQELFIKLLLQAYIDSGEYLDDPVDVQGAADVDAIEHVPLVLVTTGQGTMVSNGGPSLGWNWQVHLSILHFTKAKASDLADHTYELMHGFHDQGASLPGVGAVSYVDDISMPAHTATSITPAGGLTQYDGTWAAIVRKL